MPEKFDVIVVGAGPAGCAAAYRLASKGYDVLLLEKAKVPGHRNMTGGVLYGKYVPGYGLIDLLPGFEGEAPLERKIVEHKVYVISKPKDAYGEGSYRVFTIGRETLLGRLGVTGLDLGTGHDYSVLRAKFDRWFASKVVEVGGMLQTETAVEDLIWKDGQVVGVKANDEELYADIVIDAGGVTSSLVEKAGLRGKLEPEDVYFGIKHVYKLKPEVINERFGVKDGQGKALFFFGDFMLGVPGGAFIYTNKDTLSVGIVCPLRPLLDKCVKRPDQLGKPLELLEGFELHPMISRLIEGGTLVEYSAHNIPKGPRAMLKRPYGNGFLAVGDALGAFVKMGALIDGMRRAIASGIMAAEAYEVARGLGDFSERGLAYYKQLLRPIYRDIRASRLNGYMTESRLAYGLMPAIAFGLGLAKKVRAEANPRTPDERDMIQKIQFRTGLLDYEEDREYSHIQVNEEGMAKSPSKPWVPACPYNCYMLVLDKGIFTSFKDLHLYNLDLLRRARGLRGRALKAEALRVTKRDIALGQVKFDWVPCVGCGTCGVIGPRGVVDFGHERFGHGVKYKYG